MGCNTSSDAKSTKEEKDAQENQTNTKTEEKQKEPAEECNDSEAEAATKIQAAFRGHQTRKSISMKANKPNQEPEPEPTKSELEAEFRADDKELCNAATKIQASFRGHQARKQTQVETKTKEQQDKEDIEKIDLADPDLNKAATKIQASFRGHKVRKDTTN
ncbi:sperm surface protein Sp17 [Vanessa atalanta]|uniref:sperm surface protein Sp17 n=1 Tax=Vanessa atalanta TaxID=42275 RepID=UPI001FCE0A58|nr:sperm surface protein Sp17 [Vanessa atalanta]